MRCREGFERGKNEVLKGKTRSGFFGVYVWESIRKGSAGEDVLMGRWKWKGNGRELTITTITIAITTSTTITITT